MTRARLVGVGLARRKGGRGRGKGREGQQSIALCARNDGKPTHKDVDVRTRPTRPHKQPVCHNVSVSVIAGREGGRAGSRAVVVLGHTLLWAPSRFENTRTTARTERCLHT